MLSFNSNTLDSFSNIHVSFDMYCSIFLFLSLESLFINIRPNINFNLKIFNDELLKSISNIYHSSLEYSLTYQRTEQNEFGNFDSHCFLIVLSD